MPADNLLLVVDVQEQTMRFLSGKTSFLERVNRIIRTFQEKGQPIFYVKQKNMGSLYPQLVVDNDAPVFTKKEPSAFSEASFTKKVEQEHPKNVVVVGLMSQACVQSTVKSALNRDYSVTLISDGHDSLVKPMRHHYNQLLTKLGAHRLTTDEFMLVN
ncbi:isochorismatase family cysteine hydrolase [Lactobacillus xylocopicola]|uniref:Isochorismatase-like domain-containing protein n=1 Tax=Lactobacillus xylocopicola TaxID=2976676 RepID=A0ABM8BI84_9LACO|nr:isochorismatase family cysteine hydrolase [Lactobacillus xylocopicola]BDR60999.1 hypothetical protein KIM322_12600 [Lactobacillus xylocopicola]